MYIYQLLPWCIG